MEMDLVHQHKLVELAQLIAIPAKTMEQDSVIQANVKQPSSLLALVIYAKHALQIAKLAQLEANVIHAIQVITKVEHHAQHATLLINALARLLLP